MKRLCKLLLSAPISCMVLLSSFAFGQYHGGEKITFEGVSLGMVFDLPTCSATNENTATSCQIFLGEERVKDHTLQNYRVQLGTQVDDHLSSTKYIFVGTINGKIAQITILTAGLPQQEEIWNTLQQRLGDPSDNFTVSEQDTQKLFPHITAGSIMTIWVTRDGEISFTGEISPEGYGIITMHAAELLAK